MSQHLLIANRRPLNDHRDISKPENLNPTRCVNNLGKPKLNSKRKEFHDTTHFSCLIPTE